MNKRIMIHWFVNAVRLFKTGKNVLDVGICAKTEKIAFIGLTPMDTLIMRDLFVSENGCEEQNRCINLDCPLNKTTLQSFNYNFPYAKFEKKHFKGHIKHAKQFTKLFDKEIKQICSHNNEKSCTMVFKKPPLTIHKNKKR